MKINPSNLSGPQLDWAVAKCEGYYPANDGPKTYVVRSTDGKSRFHDESAPAERYSTDWAQGGPIIEREKINTKSNLTRMPNHPDYDWQADCPEKGQCVSYHGPTPLIAAMRCYVASKLGNIIDIPEELS